MPIVLIILDRCVKCCADPKQIYTFYDPTIFFFISWRQPLNNDNNDNNAIKRGRAYFLVDCVCAVCCCQPSVPNIGGKTTTDDTDAI